MEKQNKLKVENLEREIERVVNKELNIGGFDGKVVVEEYDEKPCFFAGIDTQEMKNINIRYNPHYEQENQGKTTIVIADITRHEINHKGYEGFNGCPRNLENHAELIIEPMAEVLAKKGYGLNDILFNN